MSKDMRTAAANKLVQQHMRKALEECTLKDCEFCEELQKVLDATGDADSLHIESTG